MREKAISMLEKDLKSHRLNFANALRRSDYPASKRIEEKRDIVIYMMSVLKGDIPA